MMAVPAGSSAIPAEMARRAAVTTGGPPLPAVAGGTMDRIVRALAAILLLPVIVAGAAWLMSWPSRDQLYYLSIGWVVGWSACYLVARAVAWVVSRWVA